MGWAEYKRTIANARLLVSAYREASTGSLALLDGYRMGKQVLLSDSEWNGAKQVFGPYGNYFRWDSRGALKEAVKELTFTRKTFSLESYRSWVDDNYGEPAFARAFADRMRKVVGC